MTDNIGYKADMHIWEVIGCTHVFIQRLAIIEAISNAEQPQDMLHTMEASHSVPCNI